MGAYPVLRRRPKKSRRQAPFSAWAMSIVFAAIAAISFAIDHTMTLSLVADGDRGELPGPAQLLQSWIDTASGSSHGSE